MATTVGEVKIALSFDKKSLSASVDSATKDIESKAGNAGSKGGSALTKGWSVATAAITGITMSVFNKVTDIVTGAVDTAVRRFDTMNNFPRVMENLGISADESSKAIKTISEGIRGIPTRLDDAALAVQRFTSVNNDLDKSTDLFLAVNNAILAGGASADIQSTALEQLTQAYSKGKPDMIEWRSLMVAMPAQLKQVAKAMGKTSDELGEGLRNGDIAMDEFLDTIVKLNKEGTGEFASFEKQAKGATGGIGTSMSNLTAAVSRGITKILDAFGSESITTAIASVGSAIETLGGIVAGVINFIAENEVVRTALIAFLTTLGILLMTSVVPAFIAWTAAMLANPLTWIVAGITAVITALILLITHIDEVGKFFNSVFGGVVAFIGEVVGNIAAFFQGLWEGLMAGLENIKQFFENIFGAIGTFVGGVAASIGAVFSGVFDGIKAGVQAVGSFFNSIFSGIGSFVGGIASGIGNAFNNVFNGLKSFGEGVGQTVSGVFGAIGGVIKAPINGISKGVNGVLSFINSIKVPDWVPLIGGAHTNFGMIPMLASGGVTSGATTAIIGEQGTEAVLPLDRNTDNWSGLLADTLLDEMAQREFAGSGIKVEMNNYINNEMDADEIGRRMMASIRRAA